MSDAGSDEWGSVPLDPEPATDEWGSVPLEGPVTPQEQIQADDDRLGMVFEAARNKDPNKWAGILSLQERTGLPVADVEARYDSLLKMSEAAKYDSKEFRTLFPGTYKWVNENPKRAPLVTRDEGLLSWGSRMGTAVGRLFDDLGASPLGMMHPALGVIDGIRRAMVTPEEIGADVAKVGEAAERKTETREQNEASGAQMFGDAWSRGRKAAEKSKIDANQILFDQEAANAEASGDPVRIEAARRAAYENRAASLQLSEEIGGIQDYGQGTIGQLGLDVIQGLTSQIDTIQAGGAGALAGGIVGGAVGALGGPGGVAAGAGLGWKVLSFAQSFRLEAGGAYGELLETKLDDKTKVDPAVARVASIVYGLAAAGIEVWALGEQMKAFGPMGHALSKGRGIAWMKEALADRSMGSLWQRLAKDWVKSTGSEAAEELAQGSLQFIGNWAARSVSAGTPQSFDTEQFVKQGTESAYLGAVGGGFGMGAAGVGVQLARESVRTAGSKRAGAQVAKIAELGKHPTSAQAPRDIARMVEIETERSGEKVTHLYIDPEALTRLAKEQGAEPEAVAKELMGAAGPDRMRAALAERVEADGSRATLEVPLAEYLEKWGSKPIAEQLILDTTTRPGYRTAREERLFQPEVDRLAKQLAGEAQEGEATDPELQVGANEAAFIKTLEGQLIDSQRMTPDEARKSISVTRAFIRTMAKRMGAVAEEQFGYWRMSVGSEATDLNAAPEASRRLTEKLATMGPQDRARVLFVDPNTQLFNARGFAALPADPARPLVAHISVEGTKWKNRESHTAGNLLYRMVAQELRTLSKDAAKWGGDFVANVATDEDAKGLQARLQELVRDRLRKENPELAAQIGGLEVTVRTAQRGSDVGVAVAEAGKLNATAKAKLEGDGTRAKRGDQPKGLPVGDPTKLLLPTADAAVAEVPAELLAAVQGMTEKQVFDAALIEPSTGMLTREGFFMLPPKKHVISIDLNGLKAINEKYDTAMGDYMLDVFADLAKLAGGSVMDMAHLSGDEYAAQTDDPELAQLFVDILGAMGDLAEVHDKETKRVVHGITFGYGIGNTYDDADKRVEAHKGRERASPGTEVRLRTLRAAHSGRSGVHPGRRAEVLARGATPQSFSDRGKGVRKNRRAAKSATELRRRIYRARLEALQSSDPKEVALRLLQVRSPESAAAADLTADRLLPPSPPKRSPSFRSKAQAWTEIMAASFPEGSDGSPSEQADSQYEKAQRGTAEMPGVFPGGTFDVVNEHLDLRGKDRVKGLRHAFDLLTKGARTFEAIEPALEILRQVPGLEGLRMPDSVIEAQAAEEAKTATREAEAEEMAEFEDELDEDDDSFDPETFYQPAFHGTAADIDRFSTGKAGSAAGGLRYGWGLYFSSRQKVAEFYRVEKTRGDGGQVLQVEVPEDADLLDRDKPISEQPAIAAKLEAAGIAVEGEQTGAEVYAALTERLGGAQQTSTALLEAGIPGATVVDKNTGKQFVIWDDDAIEITKRLNQPVKGDDTKRGWVDIARKGMQRSFRIFLTEHSDLSTFLHESAHTYLEMMGDLAAHPEADDRVVRDFNAILQWLGAESREAITEEQQEKFARGFEAFLLEGNAPSSALAESFAAFRLWLKEIYKTITSLNVELNDDIRGVFGRMLATDDEISRMQKAAGLDVPMWRSHVEAGMTPKEWETYLRDRAESTTRTAMRVQRAVAEAQLRATEAYETAEFKKLKETATEEWQQRDDWRALRFITRGERRLEDGRVVKDKDQGKLDKAEAQKLLGTDSPTVKVTLRGRLIEDGENPTQVARDFGFRNGADMFAAIAAMPDQEATVQARAEEMMRERHPEIDGEIARLSNLVQETLHNEGNSDWLLGEWATLKRRAQRTEGAGKAEEVPVEAVRKAARELVDGKAIGRLDLGQTLNSERAAAERAAVAAAKGDYKKAFLYKQQQLLHHFAWRELSKASKDRDSFLRDAERLATRRAGQVFGKAGAEFLDLADQLLGALGLLERRRGSGPQAPIAETLAELEARGIAAVFPAELAQKVLDTEKGWQSLTVAEMREVRKGLVLLYHTARGRNSITLDGKRVALGDLAKQIQTEASELADKGPAPGSETAKRSWWAKHPTKLQDGSLALQGIGAALTDPEQMLKDLGPTAHKALWQEGYIRGRTIQDQLADKVLRHIADAWEKLPKELRDRRFDTLEDLDAVPFPADLNRDGSTRDRQWMWMVALNMGNASNRDRLLGGYQWDEAAVIAWLDKNMSREEWEWVQSVWDLLDKELYPEVERAFKEATGLPPVKIEALPIQTHYGTFKGGYFPAKYDPVASRVGQDQTTAAERALTGGKAGQASVMKGFTAERVKRYTDVINLQWAGVPAHVSQVIHYVAFDRVVRDGAALLYYGGESTTNLETGEVEQVDSMPTTIQRRLGLKYERQLTAWLQVVANDQADAIPHQIQDVMRPMQAIRGRFVTSALGYSLTVAAGDLTNAAVVVAKGDVSARHMTAAALETIPLVTYGKTRSWALGKSPELRHRSENFRRQMMIALAEVGKQGQANPMLRTVRESAWFLMEATDRYMSTMIWNGAYRQSLAQGMSEGDAVAHAESVVRGNLPSHNAAEQPAVLRDKRGFGALVVFYGYFSKLYNIQRSIWHDAANDFEKAEGFGEKLSVLPSAGRAMGRSLAVILVANVVGELLSGRGPDDGESEEEWITRKMVTAPFLMIPFVGGVLEQAVGLGVSAAFGDTEFRRPSMRGAPAAAGIDRLIRSVGNLADGERATDQRVWDALEVAGILSGTPIGSSQVTRTGRYITSGGLSRDLESGDVVGIAGGLVYGERR